MRFKSNVRQHWHCHHGHHHLSLESTGDARDATMIVITVIIRIFLIIIMMMVVIIIIITLHPDGHHHHHHSSHHHPDGHHHLFLVLICISKVTLDSIGNAEDSTMIIIIDVVHHHPGGWGLIMTQVRRVEVYSETKKQDQNLTGAKI